MENCIIGFLGKDGLAYLISFFDNDVIYLFCFACKQAALLVKSEAKLRFRSRLGRVLIDDVSRPCCNEACANLTTVDGKYMIVKCHTCKLTSYRVIQDNSTFNCGPTLIMECVSLDKTIGRFVENFAVTSPLEPDVRKNFLNSLRLPVIIRINSTKDEAPFTNPRFLFR